MSAAIPGTVIWAYSAFTAILAIGVITLFVRGDWQKAHGLDKLVLLGPLFYAAPLTAFGTEHLTLTNAIASLVPKRRGEGLVLHRPPSCAAR